MIINLNGQEKNIEEVNIFDLVESLDIEKNGVVILHNDEVVKKEKWRECNLIEKDSVEVLYFVSGG